MSLSASKSYSPAKWFDDERCLSSAFSFAIPKKIPIPEGASIQGNAELVFRNMKGRLVSCLYSGDDRRLGWSSWLSFLGYKNSKGENGYGLQSCSDWSRAEAIVNADYVRLHVGDGDHRATATKIQLSLGDVGSGGDVLGTQVYTSTDPRAAGASLTVYPGDAAAFQTFSLSVFDPIVRGAPITDPRAGRFVAKGPAVTFDADNSTGEFLFAATAPCATITLPYDATVADPSSLKIYQVTEPSSVFTTGGITIAALAPAPEPQTINAVNHTISFCAAHLSIYFPATTDETRPSYQGGPLMLTNKTIHLIYFGKTWFTNESASAQATLEEFASHIGGSPYLNTLTTYGDTAGNVIQNVLTKGASAYVYNSTLDTNQEVSNALEQAISQQLGGPDSDAIYVLLPSPEVTTLPSVFCNLRACGYHSNEPYMGGSTIIKYAVVLSEALCNTCGGVLGPPFPNGQLADSIINSMLHETVEAITDPITPTGWATNYKVDAGPVYIEVGDICVGADLTDVAYKTPNGALADAHIHGNDYQLQKFWVNEASGYCGISYDDEAQFVSVSTPTQQLVGGSTYPVSITMHNIGSTTWTAAENYDLFLQEPSAAWAPVVSPMSGGDAIMPPAILENFAPPVGKNQSLGDSKTFTFDLTVPNGATGTINLQWIMRHNGVAFGAAGSLQVYVQPPAAVDDAINSIGPLDPQIYSPLGIESATCTAGTGSYANECYLCANYYSDISATMLNTGTSTWNNGYYWLVPVPPSAGEPQASWWEENLLFAPEFPVDVSPSEVELLAAALPNPPLPLGDAALQWQMYHDATGVFGAPTEKLLLHVVSCP